MIEHRAGVAEEFVRHMHWDVPPDTQEIFYQWPWLNTILEFLRMFLPQNGQGNRLHEGWWGVPRIPVHNPPHEVQTRPSTVCGDNVAAASAVSGRLNHFVCICVRHMSRAKYLHHVEVNRNAPPTEDKNSTDYDMFKAIQRRYHSVRPWWKRLLFCARLSSVQYYEVCLSSLFRVAPI